MTRSPSPPKKKDVKSPPPSKADEDFVECFITGGQLLRKEARLVKLGPGRIVWLPKECCRPG